jgi:hypothetical protein
MCRPQGLPPNSPAVLTAEMQAVQDQLSIAC